MLGFLVMCALLTRHVSIYEAKMKRDFTRLTRIRRVIPALFFGIFLAVGLPSKPIANGENVAHEEPRTSLGRFDNLTVSELVAGGGGNSAPTDMAISGGSVLENSGNGTAVGTVTTADPDVGETFRYVLPVDASGRFAINTSTGKITVANGELLDFEADASHAITVRVTDSTGNVYNESFTINVTDVVDERDVPAFDPVNDTGRLAGTRVDWVALVDAAVAAGGTITHVSNPSELNAAMDSDNPNSAKPGDIVALATSPTSYPENNITLGASGTVAKPIIVVPADMLDRTGGFGKRGVNFQARITIIGSNIIFGGFSINGGAPIPNNDSAIVIRGASNVRITDMEARDTVSESWDGFIDLRRAESFRLDHSYFNNNDQAIVRLYEGPSTNPSHSFNTVLEYNTFVGQKFPYKIGSSWWGDQFSTNTRVHYNQLVAGKFPSGAPHFGGGMSAKTSNVHAFRNYLKGAGALKIRSGLNSSIIGNYIENSASSAIYLAGGKHVITNNVIVNPNRKESSNSGGITLKYGYPTAEESHHLGHRWALNNSLIANNTIVGARRNGIVSQYNANPNFVKGHQPDEEGYGGDKEMAVPFDNVIVNNVVVSDNDPSTVFRGAYRFGINDNGLAPTSTVTHELAA